MYAAEVSGAHKMRFVSEIFSLKNIKSFNTDFRYILGKYQGSGHHWPG